MRQNEELIARLEASRRRAVTWLLHHVGAVGRPAGADVGNGWARLAWALAISGETAAAASTMDWVLREGIDADGNFRAGPARGSGLVGAYLLGQLAMGALHVGRYDVATPVLDRLGVLQRSDGGMPIDLPGGALHHIADVCSTAQAGLAGLLGGREQMAEKACAWLIGTLELQSELPGRLYVGRDGSGLVQAPPPGTEFLLKVDYAQPRQAYYYSGIAAAFLGAFAMRSGDARALAAGHQYLDLNVRGTEAQFTDRGSVQICKFGWGAAMMQTADRSVRYDAHLRRMGNWFVERQAGDGSWAPSRFLSASPSVVELMTKTAEHVMEVNALIAALALPSAGHRRAKGP